MKVYTQNQSQQTLTVQQRFGLGCISGAVAHAVFYPLEVSETGGGSDRLQGFCSDLRSDLFSVVLCLLSSAPQVLKVRLNLQQAGAYRGMAACARSIYRHEALSSFYRGFKPSILCMIPYAGVECAVHQVSDTRLHQV